MKRHGSWRQMLVSGWALLLAGTTLAQDGPILFDAGSSEEPAASAVESRPVARPNGPARGVERDTWPLERGNTQSNRSGDQRGSGLAAGEQERKYREWLNSRQNQRRNETQLRTGGADAQSQRGDTGSEPRDRDTQRPAVGGPRPDRLPERIPNRLDRPTAQPAPRTLPGASVGGRGGKGQPLLRNWGDERSGAGGAQAPTRATQTPDRGAQSWQRPTQPYQRGMQPAPGGTPRQPPAAPQQQRALQPAQRGWQNPQYDPRRTVTPPSVAPRGPAPQSARRPPVRDDLWSDSSNQGLSRPKQAQPPTSRGYQQRAAQPAYPRTSGLSGGALRR